MAVSQHTRTLPGARQILAHMPRSTIHAAIDALMDELDRRDVPTEDLEPETLEEDDAAEEPGDIFGGCLVPSAQTEGLRHG
ncbi:hypothetical protein [Nitrospirillum viridazoti]|uniref:Uncharacterized protein n=1 Tax=Nitrospirillum amazonense TaxID=28077 RepID=A0A560IZ44_9PROT|nr:hypothetical protein [Nitrospirillum amazonense]TWB62244.1 hypothetical protein FBZ92_105179 [Nitrospirillum amazonense]